MKTRDSLGGQNSHGIVSGARSSRALSTIFKKLRKCDREIQTLDGYIFFETMGGRFATKRSVKLKTQRKAWDEKRRELRNERKRYTKNSA